MMKVTMLAAGAALMIGSSAGDVQSLQQAQTTEKREASGPTVGWPVVPADAVQFDLICDVQSKIIRDLLPEEDHSSHYSTERTWKANWQYAVDLHLMAFCLPNQCDRPGPSPIVAANSERLVLFEGALEETIERTNGRFASRVAAGHGLTESTGQCRRAPFSGFPPYKFIRRGGDTHEVEHDSAR